jgi:hypothetical protein
MQRENHAPSVDPIELGTVSGDTKGDLGRHWEVTGLRGVAGLSDD